MSRRKGFLIAAILVVGSVALAALLVSLAPEPETREPLSQIPFVDTTRVVAGSGPIPVHGAGTVRPDTEIDIAPQVGGRVIWVNPGFRSGGRLTSGQSLFRIEEEDYRYRVREAEAAVAARKVALLEAREDAEIARAEYERYSERQEGKAKTEASPLTLRKPQLEAARAALAREEAALSQANLALSRTRITAPFDGVVREEFVDVGQLVTAGQIVGRLFSSDAVEVVVPLSDTSAALIPGLWASGRDAQNSVKARVSAEYADVLYVWQGYVDRVEASLDVETRTINVIVRVPEPFSIPATVVSNGAFDTNPPLLVGKFVEVEIEGSVSESYFRVRRAALQAGNEIWTVHADGKVRIVPVRVLQRIDDEIYVTGALEDGQTAIIGGIRFATNGMVVRTGLAPQR